ncbi:MAG: class A beta-lactamase-related serine hydrolase [Dehalococcoidia bacterium]|nr:class A beta-lactamase-related serine hydrolase [Dehalococcoidia bacterium]
MLDAKFVAKSPADIGIDQARLKKLYDYVESQGLSSAQVALGRHGKVAGFHAFGNAKHGDTTSPASASDLYFLGSTTKVVVGAAVWGLIEDNKLKISERVIDIVPEFCVEATDDLTVKHRGDLTVEHVLLHKGGFTTAPMNPLLWEDREGRANRMRRWRLNWAPGTKWEYHPNTGHWVLAEIIFRRTGKDFRDYIRERITVPMGVPELCVGLPDSLHHRAADIVYMETVEPPPGGWGEVSPQAILNFNTPSSRRSGNPGAAALASAAELALFFQRLVNLKESAPYTPLKAETIKMATQVRTTKDDKQNGVPVNRGLSIVIAGAQDNQREGSFGSKVSPQTIGHGGAGGQIAWGDPVSGLSFGFVTNGFVANEKIRARGHMLSTLAAECAL